MPMQPDLDYIGKKLVSQNGGQPASAYYDGTLYLFSYQDGVIRAQPCTAMAGSLSDGPALLYYLYKTVDGRTWTPVTGSWQSVDDAETQMATMLSASPLTQVGAYAWDGQSMAWKFF